jgi:hypothetical protein
VGLYKLNPVDPQRNRLVSTIAPMYQTWFQSVLSNVTCAATPGSWMHRAYPEVGLCRLNQVDPYPIAYNLSNP